MTDSDQTFPARSSYTKDQLIECGQVGVRGPGSAQLPVPPMLMMDRVVSITADGGAHGKGFIHPELDISPDLWFFDCHFPGDPVMPGCLGLDAMWQLVGFFLTWSGAPGSGRALGAGEIKFTGQVLPTAKLVRYEIDIRRVINRKLVLGIADAKMFVDDRHIYSANNLRVGLFSKDDLASGAM